MLTNECCINGFKRFCHDEFDVEDEVGPEHLSATDDDDLKTLL